MELYREKFLTILPVYAKLHSVAFYLRLQTQIIKSGITEILLPISFLLQQVKNQENRKQCSGRNQRLFFCSNFCNVIVT